jgi:hypothetical protein
MGPLFAPLVFLQPGHDLDEVAGHVAVIELMRQDLVPTILAGAGRAGQSEQVGSPGDAAAGPALHRRGADLGHRDMGEDGVESLDFLLVDIAMGLDGDIAPGQPGAAGRDHHIDPRVGDPVAQLCRDPPAIVDDDASFSHSPVVWIDLESWQTLAGAGDTTSVIVLNADSSVSAEAVDGAIVIPINKTFSAIGSFSEENGSLQMIRWFLLVISALVVRAFFTVWTIQRRHDVAVLKAMGASTRYLLVDALGQASIVLIGAALVGGTLGFLVGQLLSGVVPFASSVGTTVTPLASLVAIGLAGAALAIRSITKVDPLSALGGN